jgi:hypothetical protein
VPYGVSMTSRLRFLSVAAPRSAALIVMLGLVVFLGLVTVPQARAADVIGETRPSPEAALVDVPWTSPAAITSAARWQVRTLALPVPDARTVTVAAPSLADEAGEPGGYGPVMVVAVILLVLGSVGRVVGMWMHHRHRQGKQRATPDADAGSEAPPPSQ